MRKQSPRLLLRTGGFGEVWKTCGYAKEKGKPVAQRGWKWLGGMRWDAAGPDHATRRGTPGSRRWDGLDSRQPASSRRKPCQRLRFSSHRACLGFASIDLERFGYV